MKKIIFLMLLLPLLTFITIKAQWEYLGDNGFYGNCEAYCFAVDSNCTFTGTDCGIWTTTNNGDEWIKRDTSTAGTKGIQVLAVNDSFLYIGTDYYGILVSTDKGYNWKQKNNGLIPNVYLTGKWPFIWNIVPNGKNIFAGTSSGVFFSSDNGEKWILKNDGLPLKDTLGPDIGSMIIKENNIYVSTLMGVFLSTNNGDHWSSKNNGLSNIKVSALLVKGDSIYAGTDDGIYLSTVNGDNWKNVGFKGRTIKCLYIKNNYFFTVYHDEDSIYMSTNNGLSWTNQSSGYEGGSATSFITNGDYVFISTIFNLVYRAKLSDLITNVKETVDNNGTLIYPNPASSSVKVKYVSANYSKLQISIFDLLGNEVFNTSEDCNIGMNEKTIDCSSLETGYYIIRLKQGERVEAKPLLLITN